MFPCLVLFKAKHETDPWIEFNNRILQTFELESNLIMKKYRGTNRDILLLLILLVFKIKI